MRELSIPPAVTLAALILMLISLVVMTKQIVEIRLRAAEEHRAALAAFDEAEPTPQSPISPPSAQPAPAAPPAARPPTQAAPDVPRGFRLWLERAEAIQGTLAGATGIDALKAAERLARLNLAAARIWNESMPLDAILAEVDAPPDQPASAEPGAPRSTLSTPKLENPQIVSSAKVAATVMTFGKKRAR